MLEPLLGSSHDTLQALLEKALAFYPAETRERLLHNRRRSRRRGKPQ